MAGLVAVAGTVRPAVAQDPSPLVGSWSGRLDIGAVRLRLTLEVSAAADGSLRAVFTSVDQGGARFPATVAARGDSAVFTAPDISGTYRAVLSASRDSLVGEWQQGGSLPLVMVRGADREMALRRPQHPQPPFPYRTEEVAFAS